MKIVEINTRPIALRIWKQSLQGLKTIAFQPDTPEQVYFPDFPSPDLVLLLTVWSWGIRVEGKLLSWKLCTGDQSLRHNNPPTMSLPCNLSCFELEFRIQLGSCPCLMWTWNIYTNSTTLQGDRPWGAQTTTVESDGVPAQRRGEPSTEMQAGSRGLHEGIQEI